MGKHYGLLEPAFADAMSRASHADFKFHCRDTTGVPADAPRSELAIVKEVLDFYRANQELVDAAYQNATDYLKTSDGVAHVKALEGSMAGGEVGPLTSELAGRIWDGDAFRTTRDVSESAGLSTMGIGVSGDAFAWWGVAGGAEGLVPLIKGHSRTWHTTRERELLAGVTGGLSLSFWWDYPLSGCIFGLVVQLALGAGVRVMLIRQRTEDSDTVASSTSTVPKPRFPIAGFALQFGLGVVVFPFFAVGYYVGNQKSRERVPDLSIDVETADGTNTITVNTEETLSVSITAGIDYSLAAGATVTLNMPYFFTSDDVANMTITGLPSNWSYAAETGGTNLILTTSSTTSWSARSTVLEFTINNVETSGIIDDGTINYGFVTATLDTGSETKIAVATLDLAWKEYSASVTWSAAIGDDEFFTLTGPTNCSGQSTCEGGPVDAYCQSSYAVTSLATATDGDGNQWEFGYQFNYTGTDNTPQIRAVMWQVDSSTVVIPNSGSWINPDHSGSPSVAQYKGTTGNTSFTITPIYNS